MSINQMDNTERKFFSLKLLIPENIDPFKNLDDFLLELPNKRKVCGYHNRCHIWKIQDKVTDIIGPLSELWVMIDNANSGEDSDAPMAQMDTVLELLEKAVLIVNWTM